MRMVQYGLILAMQAVLVTVVVTFLGSAATSAPSTDPSPLTGVSGPLPPGATPLPGDPTDPVVNGKPVSAHLAELASVLEDATR